MNRNRKQLLARLEAIALAVQGTGRGLALLGLGSVGMERDRLDDYSDLDFFVIAKPGEKRYFLDSLAWLEAVQLIVFSFQNTDDGHKLLFADGVFCETAVFEPHELAGIPYSGARVIWQDTASDLRFPASNQLPEKRKEPASTAWLVNEILSNLYVGLGRFWRGEKLSAVRFIQIYAVERLLELAPIIEGSAHTGVDPFDRWRRFEQHYPDTASELSQFIPGYQHSPQAALAILGFLERNFAINMEMKKAINDLCQR